MDHKQAFGAALREQRTRKRLTQDELAYQAGMDRGHVSILELGQKSPTLDTMVRLCSVLGVRVSVLILRMEELLKNSHGS